MLTHQYVYYYQDITLKLNMHEMYFELHHIEKNDIMVQCQAAPNMCCSKLLFLKSEISPPNGYTKYCTMRTGNTYPHHTLRTACIGVA